MPLSPPLLAGAAFALAAGLSAVAATALVGVVEDRSAAAVAGALAARGHDWATVLADGLQVVIEGEAPSEAHRFRVLSVAGDQVDASRVIDNMRVAEADPLAPPDFAIEILRGEGGVSIIGLVPASIDREALADAVAEAADGQAVTDLLQVADYPAPPGWEPSLDFAVDALAGLPRSKMSVSAGRVAIEAISDSPDDRRRIEAELAAAAPEGVRLALDVSAPRPVITPFTLRFGIEDGRAAFDACSADTAEARGRILAAATLAGAEGRIDCRLGLGSPSPDWGSAVALGIAALHEAGGGTLTFRDAEVALVGAVGTDRALFDRVAGKLDGALPEVFSLTATLPVPEAESAAAEGPPQFRATLAQGGAVRLGGRVADELMNDAALTFAKARFGAAQVTLATRVVPDGLPEGWSVRVLAGLDALSRLADGSVTVTPDLVAVRGRAGDAAAGDEIARGLIDALGAEARLDVDVTYDVALDPVAGLPTPQECLRRIVAITDTAKITFDPGSATIAGDAEPVIEAVAEVVRACGDLRLRIAGYTDSQGRDEMNLELSQARADAVLAALRSERVPVAGFESVGRGEADPIADNDTEAGRVANRRIEFTLIGAEGPPGPDGQPGADGAAPAEGANGPAPAAEEAADAGDAAPPRLTPPARGAATEGGGPSADAPGDD